MLTAALHVVNSLPHNENVVWVPVAWCTITTYLPIEGSAVMNTGSSCHVEMAFGKTLNPT